MVEHLGFTALRRRDEMLIKDLEDIFADVGKLSLDLLTVFLDQGDLVFVALGLFFLFDRCHDPPRGTARTDYVLVGNGKEVSLFDGKLLVGGSDNLHVLHHLCYWSALLGIEDMGDSPS